MSVAEILKELPKLSVSDQSLIRERIDELMTENFTETTESLAAIDEGLHSAETEPSYSVGAVREELPKWFTKSS